MSTSPVNLAEGAGAKALAAIPVVGPILSQVANAVLGAFSSAHATAVKKEATVLNQALPTFILTCETIIEEMEKGRITEADALAALANAQTAYESAVSSIISDNGTCFAGCLLTGGSTYTWPNQAAINAFNGSNGPGGQLTLKKGLATIMETTHCCNSGTTCNAACCLRCGVVIPTVNALASMIANGSGTWVIPATATNGAIQGTSAVQITYKAPNVLTVIEGKILEAL